MIVLQEEELRCSGDPKFSHLSDDLHIEITAFAPPAEAHARIAYALAEVRRFLVPVSNNYFCKCLLQKATSLCLRPSFELTNCCPTAADSLLTGKWRSNPLPQHALH